MIDSKKTFKSVEEMRAAVQDEERTFVYGRGAHPSLDRSLRLMSELDGHEGVLAFGSGMGAISAVLCSFLATGDHIALNRSGYSWTRHLVNHHLVRWGIQHTWIEDSPAPVNWEGILRENTKILYLELPTYFTFETPDFRDLLAEAKRRRILSVLDNTFAGPANYSLTSEFDVVVYSATKVIVGNGLDLGGYVCTSNELRSKIFHEGLMSLGAIQSSRVAVPMERGLETYSERTSQIAKEAKKFLVGLLEMPGAFKKIYSPWIRDGKWFEHPDFRFPVGLCSVQFNVRDDSQTEAICDRFREFQLGVSYGAPKALAMPSCAFRRPGHDSSAMTGMVRLATGERPAEALLADLRQALQI